MREVLLSIAFFAVQLGFAQLTIRSFPQQESALSVRANKEVNEIAKSTLPFWDDFSISGARVDSIRVWGTDSTLQWNKDVSSGVFVNATLAKNPPTFKVVTFDGLTGDGNFYGSDQGLTDQLQSDSIDLSTYNQSNNIYLSFYWQAGGNVEMPDEGDSLTLDFYNFNADTIGGNPWESIWKIEGGNERNDSIFYQEMIQVEQRFLTTNFIFRFQSYGDQDGPFDAWHVDWIYLNEGRSPTNDSYLDRALSGQLSSPFSPFKTMPSNQLRANLPSYFTRQTFLLSNLDETAQPIDYQHTISDLKDGTVLYYKDATAVNPVLQGDTIQLITTDLVNLNTFPTEDSIVLQAEVFILDTFDEYLDGTNVDLRINDTIRTHYLLHDYYAYDDGTAEYAVGTNASGGQAGVQFWVEEQDTLSHIDIYFPAIDPISAGKGLTIRIYEDLEDPYPIRSQVITIENGGIDEFTRYELNRPLIVSDTFYITYEQSVNEYIGIGFDRSNDAAAQYIYEKIDELWLKNERLRGAMMIRPVFKDITDYTLGTHASENAILVYPNPSSGKLIIEGSYTSVKIYNLGGQLLLNEQANAQHDISSFPSGIYLLSIEANGQLITQKIIKE